MTNKKLTPLSELEKWIDENKPTQQLTYRDAEIRRTTLEVVKNKITELKPQEQQIIEDAFDSGGVIFGSISTGKEYCNRNFELDYKPQIKQPMKKNKILQPIIGFLLLIPFRLPISILLIKLFDWITLLGGQEIPLEVLASNVITTKIIYNLAVSVWFIYTIENLSRLRLGRKPSGNEGCFWWTFALSIILVTFMVIDAISTYQIFYKI